MFAVNEVITFKNQQNSYPRYDVVKDETFSLWNSWMIPGTGFTPLTDQWTEYCTAHIQKRSDESYFSREVPELPLAWFVIAKLMVLRPIALLLSIPIYPFRQIVLF